MRRSSLSCWYNVFIKLGQTGPAVPAGMTKTERFGLTKYIPGLNQAYAWYIQFKYMLGIYSLNGIYLVYIPGIYQVYSWYIYMCFIYLVYAMFSINGFVRCQSRTLIDMAYAKYIPGI
jgi:hypothetical protein